jgi:hypothetical protein
VISFQFTKEILGPKSEHGGHERKKLHLTTDQSGACPALVHEDIAGSLNRMAPVGAPLPGSYRHPLRSSAPVSGQVSDVRLPLASTVHDTTLPLGWVWLIARPAVS